MVEHSPKPSQARTKPSPPLPLCSLTEYYFVPIGLIETMDSRMQVLKLLPPPSLPTRINNHKHSQSYSNLTPYINPPSPPRSTVGICDAGFKKLRHK